MIRSLIVGGALSNMLLFKLSIACFGFFEFPLMGVLFFQEILIRCTFIIEDVPQSPFVDFLNFGSVSFSAVVPDLVTIVKIRQYKCMIKRFLGFKWQNVLQSVQSTYLST